MVPRTSWYLLKDGKIALMTNIQKMEPTEWLITLGSKGHSQILTLLRNVKPASPSQYYSVSLLSLTTSQPTASPPAGWSASPPLASLALPLLLMAYGGDGGDYSHHVATTGGGGFSRVRRPRAMAAATSPVVRRRRAVVASLACDDHGRRWTLPCAATMGGGSGFSHRQIRWPTAAAPDLTMWWRRIDFGAKEGWVHWNRCIEPIFFVSSWLTPLTCYGHHKLALPCPTARPCPSQQAEG
uniref:Uncharacterized protein n=1 Tax=Oryza rufipogon TaxID=4529 RepID=A0A0E0P5Y7_ORYRU